MWQIEGLIDEPFHFVDNHRHVISFHNIFWSPFMGDRLGVNNEHVGCGTALREMCLEVPREDGILYVKIRFITRRGICWQRSRACSLR